MQRPISCGLYPFTLQILSLNFTLQFLSSNISSFPLLTYRISRPGRAGPSRNWTRLERGGATSEFKYLISRNKTPMVTGNSPLLLEKNPAAKPREKFFFWYLGGKSHKIWIQKARSITSFFFDRVGLLDRPSEHFWSTRVDHMWVILPNDSRSEGAPLHEKRQKKVWFFRSFDFSN